MNLSRILPALGVAGLALVLSPGLGAADAPQTPLKKGDRIAFLGDSITQGGAAHAKGYVRLIEKALHEKYKDLDIQIIPAGISGNKVPDLQRRVDRDVIAKKATIVFIYIGINDVWHGEKDPRRGTAPDKYEGGLKEVIGKIQKSGARVILCTPSVIGEKPDGSNTNDKKLDEYAAISRKVAKEMKVPVCDLRKIFLAHLKEHNTANKPKGVLTGDGVHLNDMGNRLVASSMMRMLGN